MILCIDIGNTNIKYGLFEGDRLAVSFRGATDLKRTSDEYGTLLTNMLAIKGISPDEVKGAIISSVVPALNYTITHMCAGYLGVEPMLVGAGIKTGHNLRVDDAREVGADRIGQRRGGDPQVRSAAHRHRFRHGDHLQCDQRKG